MAPSEKSELPQGTLDLLILTIVASGPQHGYTIAQQLKQMSNHVIQVRQGSLYPALHRLEHRRLLSREWRASETGREAKYYRLTKKGQTELDSQRASWDRLAAAVSGILRTAKQGA